MDTRLLFHVDPDLSPEERWLLLQWSMVVGLDQTLTCSLLELYHRFGISPQHAKPALESLKANGYVIYETVRHGRGRPVSSHYISSGFRQCLEKLDATVSAHQPEIESLCHQAITVRASRKVKAQNLMSGEQRANMLVPATYWLLAALLAHAEAPGIVRGLSYGKLKAATGMTKERLKSQLSKLKKLGVIARHEPGVLRSQGEVRMRSVYVLDLAHPLLLGKDSVGLTAEYISVGNPNEVSFLSGFYEAALVASRLVENSERIRDKIEEACGVNESKKDPISLWKGLRKMDRYVSAYEKLLKDASSILPPIKLIKSAAADLMRIHRLGMSSILKAHVHSYALMFLSNHWADLDHERGGVKDPFDDVVASIKKDFSYLMCVTEVKEESHSNSDLLLLIYAWSHHLAVQLMYTLKFVEQQQIDCDFSTAAFSMEPFHWNGSECWRLKAHFRFSDGIVYLKDTVFRFPTVSLSWPKGMDFLVGEELT